MARPARQTFAKRQREKKRDEKRKEKEEKKKVRKIEKEADPAMLGDDIVDASSISPFLEDQGLAEVLQEQISGDEPNPDGASGDSPKP